MNREVERTSLFCKYKVKDWQVLDVSRGNSFAYICVFVAGRPSCRKKTIRGGCRIFKREKEYNKTNIFGSIAKVMLVFYQLMTN